MNSIVLINGRFVPESQASIPIDDAGFLHGAGLFETMRAESGHVFRFDAHARRLLNSAARLHLPMEPTFLPAQEAVEELLMRCGYHDARVRLTVTTGSTRIGGEVECRPTVCVTATRLSAESMNLPERGNPSRVMIARSLVSPSDPLAGHKSICYLPRLIAMREAHGAGCAEALWFTTEHLLAEGCISNVFIVRNGQLMTPPLDTPVLPGITRQVVLDLAKSWGIHCLESRLNIDDLLEAQEVFLTNSILQVTGVTGVERHTVADGKLGPVTARMADGIAKLVTRECRES